MDKYSLLEEEQNLKQEVSFAGDAELLLNNELFQEAFRVVQADLMHQWNTSTLEQQDLRENVFTAMKITEKVKESLEKTVESGKLASVGLLMLEKAKTAHFKEN